MLCGLLLLLYHAQLLIGWQAAAKLKEMEDSMLKYYMANADKAGVGLECLPGVKQLLQELKVCFNVASACNTTACHVGRCLIQGC